MENFLGRKIPAGKIGESWEVSDYGSDLSIIDNGDWSGKTFREVFQKYPVEVLGKNFSNTREFPLLVKIIDAEDKLSVQVHPDDVYSREKDPENRGKKESWYILGATEEAKIVCGFSRDLDRNEYKKLILENRAEEPLNTIQVREGDAFLINPGTVHAIGAGTLILEVQQSSDSTYRVYDYGRLGDDGKPRSLHLEKALDVLNFQKSIGLEKLVSSSLPSENGKRELIVSNDKFRMEKIYFKETTNLPSLSKESSFQICTLLKGSIRVEDCLFQRGDSFLVTAIGVEKNIKLETSENCELAIMCAGTDWLEF